MSDRLYISVIVPVYNVERYVEECLRSVMAQEAPNINLECIVVNDCGSDRSMDVVRKTIENYTGPVEFKLLAHEKNRGLSAARNTGIKAAKGEYVTFLDSDDYLLPDALSNLAKLAEKYPGVDIVQGEVQVKVPAKWMWKCLGVSSAVLPEYISGHEKSRHTILFDMPVTAWAKLIRRDFILKNGLFFTEGMVHEDDMWAVSASRFLESIAFHFTPVYWYNNDVEGSITNSLDLTRSMDGYLKVLDNVVEQYRHQACLDYIEYILIRLNLNVRRDRWPKIKDKALIRSHMRYLKMKIDNSNLPSSVKHRYTFYSSNEKICFNRYFRFIVERLINRKLSKQLKDIVP